MSEAEEKGLLPCPFCGGEAMMLKDHKLLGFYVACQDCNVCTITTGKAACAIAWNRRALDTEKTV